MEHEASWKQRNLERETGFEPATSTLARSHSTAELLPLNPSILNHFLTPDKFRRGITHWRQDGSHKGGDFI